MTVAIPLVERTLGRIAAKLLFETLCCSALKIKTDLCTSWESFVKSVCCSDLMAMGSKSLHTSLNPKFKDNYLMLQR